MLTRKIRTASKRAITAAEYLYTMADHEKKSGVRKLLFDWSEAIALVVQELGIIDRTKEHHLLAAVTPN